MRAWPHRPRWKGADYRAPARSGPVFNLSVIEGVGGGGVVLGAGAGAGDGDTSGGDAAGGWTGIMMIGSGAGGGGSLGVTSDTVTIGAGMAEPR